MDIERQFREVLREIRQEKGISQEKLAHICGMDRTYMSMIERGISSPTLSKLIEISTALEVPLSEIMARAEYKYNEQ